MAVVLSTCVAFLNEFINVIMHSFSKDFLIKELIIFVLAWPCKLCEFISMIKGKELGTIKTSNDLSASCFISNKVLTFMMNLLIAEGMCKAFYMHLQYPSCFWRLLISGVSVSKTFIGSMSVASWVLHM